MHVRVDAGILKGHRVRAGITQTEIGLAIGRDPSQISRVESGRTASPGTIKAIAEYLGVAIERVILLE
jgi:transcriptional regulator with XRE-family HTH domain